MASTNFKTENNTFRKLMGNGLTYRIPRFQRDYSWDTDEWEDLWTDIHATLEVDGEPSHYMGYLVLQSSDDKFFDVIDGQQRLTTITLIVLAVLKNIQRLIDNAVEPDANSKRLEQIRQTYIGYLDPVTLIARPKLKLNRNNDDYFQYRLVPLEHLPSHGLRSSERLLRRAFEYFDKQVQGWLADTSNAENDAGKRLAQLVEDISDRFFFTVITVTDELNAYKVFETLNARGVRLSSTDLLKNYLFSILDRNGENSHELSVMEDRWEHMVSKLQSEKFPDFLRAHWNSRHDFSRQSELFKTIRTRVNDREKAFALLREMEQDLDTYLALSSPENSGWSQEDASWAGILRHIFRVRQPFSLLLAAKRTLNAADFTGLLRATMVIALRYNVIGALGTGKQEDVYNKVARRMAKGELTTLYPTLQALREIYIDDRSFQAAFADKSIRITDARNGKVVRFLLCALEKNLSQQDYDFASTAFNIEHILPQNAPDGWGDFDNEEARNLGHRLGNMTLLESGANRDLGTEKYETKRRAYAQSGFEMARKLAEKYADWGPSQIAERQNWMAKQATSIWRVAQFD